MFHSVDEVQQITATYNVLVGEKADGTPVTDRVTLGHVSKYVSMNRLTEAMADIGTALDDVLQKEIVSADVSIRTRILEKSS